MNFGIVCEFNPFHNGHKYLFEAARKMGAENIVCAMSGNAVQRGSLAVADKYLRAEAVIKSGADLVIELPFPWSSASAEYFASAGIRVLAPYCDAVIFGSECGDIQLLKRAADVSLSESFKDEFERRKKSGEGAAEAYFSLLSKYVGSELLSNDILGVEYIKAAKKQGVELEFYTVKRSGNGYNDEKLTPSEFPSATAIRKAWNEGKDAFEEYMPKEATAVYKRAFDCGDITDEKILENAYLTFFRLCKEEDLLGIAEAEGGIADRICAIAKESKNFEEFWNALKTKRYTDAKLRRALLFSLTLVKKELLAKSPEYTYLLGANNNGRKLLSSVKKASLQENIKLITKPADTCKDSLQFDAEYRLNAIFSLARENSVSVGDMYRKNAFIK